MAKECNIACYSTGDQSNQFVSSVKKFKFQIDKTKNRHLLLLQNFSTSNVNRIWLRLFALKTLHFSKKKTSAKVYCKVCA